jgi:hypothetical protein
LVIYWNKNKICNGFYTELFEFNSEFFDIMEKENNNTRSPYRKMSNTSIQIIREYLGNDHKIDFQELNRIRCKITYPKPWIQKIINDFTEKYDINERIGLHIRRTDFIDKYGILKLKDFEKIIESSLLQRFFLATDDKKTYDYLISKYENVIGFSSSDFIEDDVRQTPLHRALIDLELLARCKKIIKTEHSSFSKLAEKKQLTCNTLSTI